MEGIIQLRFRDGQRDRIVTGYVGEGGVEKGVAYKLQNGVLVRA